MVLPSKRPARQIEHRCELLMDEDTVQESVNALWGRFQLRKRPVAGHLSKLHLVGDVHACTGYEMSKFYAWVRDRQVGPTTTGELVELQEDLNVLTYLCFIGDPGISLEKSCCEPRRILLDPVALMYCLIPLSRSGQRVPI